MHRRRAGHSTVLRHHSAWRCDRVRGAVDLDVLAPHASERTGRPDELHTPSGGDTVDLAVTARHRVDGLLDRIGAGGVTAAPSTRAP